MLNNENYITYFMEEGKGHKPSTCSQKVKCTVSYYITVIILSHPTHLSDPAWRYGTEKVIGFTLTPFQLVSLKEQGDANPQMST